MPAAIGSLIAPALMSALPSSIGGLLGMGPLMSGALGGGLGNLMSGGDFWKGTLGGLAGGMIPSGTGMMGNMLRGGLTAGIGGGNPLGGALFGGLMSGLPSLSALGGGSGAGMLGANSVSNGVWSPEHVTAYDTFMGNQMTPYSDTMNPYYGGGQNALRSMSNAMTGGAGARVDMGGGATLMPASYSPEPAISDNWQRAFGNDAAMRDVAGGATMGMVQGTPVAPQAAQGNSFLDRILDPRVLAQAGASIFDTMYKTKAAEDMAKRQEKLAREMDTGLGLRKQAAGYAMNPDSIPGSPGYQAALNERRRQLNRLASSRGMLNSGQLPAQLAGAAEQQMGDWYRYYSDTANRGGNVPYPNYQNMLRTM